MLDLNKTGKVNQGIFGLDFSFDDSEVVFIPGTWDACSSFRKGAAESIKKIKTYSPQLDLFNVDFIDFVYSGIHLLDISEDLAQINKKASKHADTVINIHETCNIDDLSFDRSVLDENIQIVNDYSQRCNDIIYNFVEKCIKENKLIGLIGGNHSCTYPVVNALIDYVDTFCILQIDAHMDLRDSYQGFTFSHASVMNNCLKLDDISRLIQVGCREFCEEEYNVMKNSKGKIKTFFDQDIKHALFNGKTWDSLCKKIINNCTDKVYVTIDVDGLSPEYSSNTGTLVPGGLSYDHVIYLIKLLSESKKTIIGFDVVESNGNINSVDIITATKLLYNIAGYAWLTHK